MLSLQALAADAPTQQVLSRLAYYAILLSSSAFACALLFVPRQLRHARAAAIVLLALGALSCLVFAANHGAFVAESVQDGSFVSANIGAMQALYPVVIWTGFLGGLLWLGWRAPGLATEDLPAARWLMAGLGLFAADRFARTAALWVRDPATLGSGLEGAAYGWFMLAFGVGVGWMLLRSRTLAGARTIAMASGIGAAVGATALVSTSLVSLGIQGAMMLPVLFSALLGPCYVALIAKGALAAPCGATLVHARGERDAVLADRATP